MRARVALCVVALVSSTACASKKAFVTMPLSGQGSVGDELKSVTLSPCRATSKDAATCTTEVNDCKYGIGKIKLVRDGKNLIVTPSCFIPAPSDCAPSSVSPTNPAASADVGPAAGDATPPGDATHPDPGDL